MTSRASFDPASLVGVLLTHSVDFVMIGGYAAELQGVSWMTVDVDIVIAASEDNYISLEAARSSSMRGVSCRRGASNGYDPTRRGCDNSRARCCSARVSGVSMC